jgi:hypothetical protein
MPTIKEAAYTATGIRSTYMPLSTVPIHANHSTVTCTHSDLFHPVDHFDHHHLPHDDGQIE